MSRSAQLRRLYTRALMSAVVFTTLLPGALFARPSSAPIAPTLRTLSGDTPIVVARGTARRQGAHNPSAIVSFTASLRVRNSARLDALIVAASEPASPRYRHYLTLQQYDADYAPTAQDVQDIRIWAKKNGLAVTQVSPDNLSITVQGATYDVERALGVTLNDYNSVAYGKFVANDRNPIVPSSLPIGSVSDISAATTIPPSSLHSRGEQSLRQDATIRPFASAPQTTPTQCSLVQRQDPNNHTCYGPRDLATAYDATSLGNASGETIAIIANDWTNPLSQTVFDNFQAGFNNVGLNGDAGPRLVETAPFMLNGSSDQRAAPEPGDNKIEYVFDYGFFTPQMEFNGDHPQFTTPIDPGDNEEAVMVEYAHGLAPGAGIEVYMAGGFAHKGML